VSLEFVRPGSIEEAIAILERGGDDAKVVAGGTAVVIMLKEGFIAPNLLVDVSRISTMRGIHDDGDGLRIGAATTIHEVLTSPVVRARFPELVSMLGRVATIRIRSRITLGGNLAHGDSRLDPAAFLPALDAEVRLVGPGGERWLPVADLFVDELTTAIQPAELLVEIRIPDPGSTSRVTYRKLVGQTQDDYGVVNVAARIDLEGETCRDARIVLGAVASTPIRVPEAEALLRDARPSADLIDQAADLARAAADPVDDLRGSAAYKADMIVVEVRRALTALAGDLAGPPPASGAGGAGR
jgi:carbon-monoxide dehydrogenase medium subunit